MPQPPLDGFAGQQEHAIVLEQGYELAPFLEPKAPTNGGWDDNASLGSHRNDLSVTHVWTVTLPLLRVKLHNGGILVQMAEYKVNRRAVSHARMLIDAHQYVLDSDWGEVQPRAKEENSFLKSRSWDEYAAWHLGRTVGAEEHTKARYAFVYVTSVACIAPASSPSSTAPPSGATRRSSWPLITSCSAWIGSAASPRGQPRAAVAPAAEGCHPGVGTPL